MAIYLNERLLGIKNNKNFVNKWNLDLPYEYVQAVYGNQLYQLGGKISSSKNWNEIDVLNKIINVIQIEKKFNQQQQNAEEEHYVEEKNENISTIYECINLLFNKYQLNIFLFTWNRDHKLQCYSFLYKHTHEHCIAIFHIQSIHNAIPFPFNEMTTDVFRVQNSLGNIINSSKIQIDDINTLTSENINEKFKEKINAKRKDIINAIQTNTVHMKEGYIELLYFNSNITTSSTINSQFGTIMLSAISKRPAEFQVSRDFIIQIQDENDMKNKWNREILYLYLMVYDINPFYASIAFQNIQLHTTTTTIVQSSSIPITPITTTTSTLSSPEVFTPPDTTSETSSSFSQLPPRSDTTSMPTSINVEEAE